jgi:hypothetical protein
MNVVMFLKHVSRRYLLALTLSVMMWITDHLFGWAAELVRWLFP